MQILLIPLFFHIVPMGVAIWGAFSRSPKIHVPAILVLMFDLVGYSLAQSILPGRWPPATLAWIMAGPILLPLELGEAVMRAPLWTTSIILVGVVVGTLLWLRLRRIAKLRAWVFAAALGGMLASLLAAEIGMEAAMRIRAAQQMPIYCMMHRQSTPDMLGSGLSAPGSGRVAHGWISNGQVVRYWSIKQTSFGEPFPCEGDAWPCRC